MSKRVHGRKYRLLSRQQPARAPSRRGGTIGTTRWFWTIYTETSFCCAIVQRLGVVICRQTGGCLRQSRAALIKGCGFFRGLQTAMIIACPNCATSYTVDGTAFGHQSRTVRCSACGHSWRQSGEAADTLRDAGGAPRTSRKKTPQVQHQPIQALGSTPAAARVKAPRRPKAKPEAPAPIVTPHDKPAPVAPPGAEPAKPKRPQEPVPATVEPGAAAMAKPRPPSATTASDAGAAAPASSPASSPAPMAAPPPEVADNRAPARGWISSAEAKECAEGDLDFVSETELPAPEPAPAAKKSEAPRVAETEPNLSATARADAREQLLAAQKKGDPRRCPTWIVPAAAVAAIAIVAGGLIVARDGIVHRFPSTAGAYSAIGMGGQPVLGAGLELRDVSSSREWSGAEEVLIIQGVVANVLKDPATLLPVRVALYDSDDQEVQAVTVPNDQNRIKPGEMVRFEARIANPSLSAQRIRVSFATPGPQQAS